MNQPCSVCREINFGNLFRCPEYGKDKGTIISLPYQWNKTDVLSNSSCPFCRTLAHGIELHGNEASSRPKIQSAPLPLIHRIMSPSEMQKWEAKLQDDSVIRVRQEIYIQVRGEHASSSSIRLNLGFGSEWQNWSSKYSIYNCIPAVTCKKEGRMAGGRVINPEHVDVDLAMSWIHTCIHDHESCHWEKQMSIRNVRARLIDTVRCCIIDAPDGCEYVALSYAWGKTAEHKLQLEGSNRRLLEREGYLAENSHLLSQTVEDAIVFCRKLDIRYLWVDSLCIIQDCKDDKAHQIGAMGDIYRNAMVTLVGAAGNDVDAGLPRAANKSHTTTDRPSRASSEEIDGIRMTVLRDDLEPLRNSYWNSRGWTFQERILSPRLLIFTSSLMLFSCSEAIWREDIATDSILAADVQCTPHSLDDWLKRKSAPSSGNDCLENYLDLLRQYIPRNLSFEADRINAFSGVLSEFSPGMGNHIWGIPERLLWAMLSWSTRRPGGHNEPLKRNNKCDEDGKVIELFPSWTWAAWIFPSRGTSIRLNYGRPSSEAPEDSVSKSLQVFALREDGKFRALYKPEWKLSEYWSHPLVDHTPVDAVDVLTARYGQLGTSVLERLLFFWTECVQLRVDRHVLEGWQGYKIDCCYGSHILVLSEERRRELPDEIEFVKLGDGLWAPVYSTEGISYRVEPTVCFSIQEEIPSYTRLVALG